MRRAGEGELKAPRIVEPAVDVDAVVVVDGDGDGDGDGQRPPP
jgi:hypothetical protein